MYIKMKISGRLTAEEVFRHKSTILVTLVQTLEKEGLFKAQKLEVWLDSWIEAEGGKKLPLERKLDGIKPTEVLSFLSRLVQIHRDRILRLVVLVEGILLETYEAYALLINVPELRRVYGDILFDVYADVPSGIGGLIDVIAEMNLYEKFNSIISYIGSIQPRPDIVVLAHDPDGFDDFGKRVSFYGKDKRRIVTDIFRTIKFRARAGMSEYEDLLKAIVPYREEKMASIMFEIRGFEHRLTELAKSSNASVSLTKSVLFLGNDVDSGQKFFEQFMNTIIRPLAEKLTKIDVIKQWLQEIISPYRRLF